MRVLVVDDDEVFREELTNFLGDEGHEPRAAPSARKALEFLASDPPDVVFTDLKMPRQSGLELLQEIRHRWPNVFVVMVTGYATVQTAVEAMKSGAFDYIAKPFRTEQVRHVLQLIAEQQKFSDTHLPRGTAVEVARELARRYQCPILFAADTAPSKASGLEFLAFDGKSPSDLPHALAEFLRDRPHGGLVVAQVDRMLSGHRIEDIVAVLLQLRQRLEGAGPFAVGIDPDRVTQTHADAVRAAVTAPAVQSALEALSSPIRRRVLYRLADGPSGFSEAMRAAELDDSPKMAFHMHRLVDEGLAVHEREQYRLTAKGQNAVGILREMENVASGRGVSAFVYQSPAARAKPPPH